MIGIITVDYERLRKHYKESIDSHFHLLLKLESSDMTWGVIFHNKPNLGNIYETEADIIFIQKFLEYEENGTNAVSIGNILKFIGPGTDEIATFEILDNCYSNLVKEKYQKE